MRKPTLARKYTSWAYFRLTWAATGDADAPVSLHVTLANTGTRDAAEVVHVCRPPLVFGSSETSKHLNKNAPCFFGSSEISKNPSKNAVTGM